MARRTFQVIDVVEALQHWHAGRPKTVVAASLGVDVKTIRKYVAGDAPRRSLSRTTRVTDRGTGPDAPASPGGRTNRRPPPGPASGRDSRRTAGSSASRTRRRGPRPGKGPSGQMRQEAVDDLLIPGRACSRHRRRLVPATLADMGY